MKRLSVILLLMVAGLARGSSQAAREAAKVAPGADAALVARGEYLANSVAMCVQCHSPRDNEGNLLVSEHFTGAPMPVSAPYWHPDWAMRAPNIAGLPGFTDEQIVALLTTGQATGRKPPMRPMPPFRMTREDAQAVVAYLRTR